MTRTAVHFGAGNIGRGFVGLLLHEGGYELVFSDVAEALVDAIDAVDSYTVHAVGAGGGDTVVTGFTALNSAKDPDAVAQAIATADVVTTAVGPRILPFIAPLIVRGLALRDPALPPVAVMACENAIRATSTLRDAMAQHAGEQWGELQARAVFADTAVDRIVPGQPAGAGVDVWVEPFFEWAIERGPFAGNEPTIPGAHFVDDLEPYIERKLFTVNTGHAATAYYGARAGIERISDALADAQIRRAVEATLRETSAVLEARHGLSAASLAEYRETILQRFQNPELPDTVWRVGRQPLRKLSRHERFIGPAADAATLGLSTAALLATIDAALSFSSSEDPEAVEMQELLGRVEAEAFVAQVTGLDAGHPLFSPIVEIVHAHQSR